MTVSVAVIGECMLELTRVKGVMSQVKNPLSMNYGGDTINTSIYLARSNIDVSYVTALGDDIMSDWLLEEWGAEGVDCSLVTRMPNSVPGMYMINVDDDGERSFMYWRKDSPASRLFDKPDFAERKFQQLASYEYIYLSGITLAILGSESCERLFGLLDEYRQKGGKIVFDGNYRPNLWSSAIVAQQAYSRMYGMTDIALPTLEDESLLFDYESADDVIKSIQDNGVEEIIVKMGGEGCMAFYDASVNYVESEIVEPVDTTAAGDSFNAGYLAARLQGQSVVSACHAGHQLAAKVIQCHGAIIPRA